MSSAIVSTQLQDWKAGVPNSAVVRTMLGGLLAFPLKDQNAIIREFDDWLPVTGLWFVMARYKENIRQLAESQKFPESRRAFLLLSKIHYCCEDYSQALECALSAREVFSLKPRPAPTLQGVELLPQDQLYINKMIEVALDTYKKMAENERSAQENLGAFIDRIFDHNMENNELSEVIGLGLDLGRIEKIEQAIDLSTDVTSILTETVTKAVETDLPLEFRAQVLNMVFERFRNQPQPDFVAMCQCLIKLEKPVEVADILKQLALNMNDLLLAYQLAFDLYENAPQEFLRELVNALFPDQPRVVPPNEGEEDAEMKDDAGDEEPKNGDNLVLSRLSGILKGEETIKHHMQFLIKNNSTDMLILKQLKDSVRTSSSHNATVIANGLMHVGTTTDDFLRDNLEWVSKAVNWNKFNVVASLGLIHKGHESNALKVLKPYLPKGEMDQYGYKEGGALYAYGLIHANHGGSSVTNYLNDQLNQATTSAIRHGASLGLGLAALATRDTSVYDALKNVLYQDDAVSGEAAGTAMGLVMAGSMDETVFNEMQQYIRDTQHDKIQRGLRTGLAILAYGKAEKAKAFADGLLREDSSAMLRQAGVLMLAMAYVGSGNAEIARKLLRCVAVDPNNDVKRFAAMGIGFVLCNEPEQCISYIAALVEQWNGHVRYGAAVALGIACAGTGYQEAVKLLEQLLQAKENYVRQGAFIALSFVLIQQTEATCASVTEFRKTIQKVATDKGEDSIVKFGAIVAQGILDAGGRNATISVLNRNGHPDMPAAVGILVFLQHWYFFSMTYFLSLSFRPTCLIGLNKDLKMPKCEFRCNAKSSMFAPPPPLEEKRKDEGEKVETAVLSTTKKKAAGAVKPAPKKDAATATDSGSKDEKMEVDEPTEVKKEAEVEKKDEKEKSKDAATPEPSSHNISNPARAVRLQLKTLLMPEGARYRPLKPLSQGGIIMLADELPAEAEEIVEQAVAGGAAAAADADESTAEEPKPHDPFEIDMNAY